MAHSRSSRHRALLNHLLSHGYFVARADYTSLDPNNPLPKTINFIGSISAHFSSPNSPLHHRFTPFNTYSHNNAHHELITFYIRPITPPDCQTPVFQVQGWKNLALFVQLVHQGYYPDAPTIASHSPFYKIIPPNPAQNK